MIPDPNLSPDDDVIFRDRAAGKTGLRRHHHVLPDPHVMSHMHQVVELRAPPDHGGIKRSAVDGRIGADLDVIADLECPYLREFFIASALRITYKSKSIASQHRPRVHHNPLAQPRSGINRHVRKQFAIPADDDTCADTTSCANSRSLADAGLLA